MKQSAFTSAVRLLEDALVLAKRANSTAWLVYLAGVVPFFGLLLFAMTDLLENPFALERLPVLALTLALLYCWLHICQSVFCGYLAATLTRTTESPRAYFAQAFYVQPALAASKLILWPITMLLLVPHPAVSMFYQHSLLAPEREAQGLRAVMSESKRDALSGQKQAIWMLVLVLFLRAILWINLLGLLLFGPSLWKTFTGIEGPFTRSPGLLVNPASLATLSLLAYIGLDPIVKAACVLRRFARQAESSGLDLRLRVATLRRVAAALLFCMLWMPIRAAAATGPTSANPPAVSQDGMREAIKSVFHDPHNIWDLPVVEPHKSSSSPFVAWMDSILNRIDAAWTSITSAIATLLKALRQIFSNPDHARETTAHPVSSVSVWAVVAVFTLLLVAAIQAALWNRRKRPRPQITKATATPEKTLDIAREDVQATDQPEDEWLRLAQQHRMAGNLRLALRALYLSTLAAFGRTGLISLARGKSNLDYVHELQRRAKRLNSDFVPLFRTNLRLFEASWYGDHGVNEEIFELFERNSSALRKLL